MHDDLKVLEECSFEESKMIGIGVFGRVYAVKKKDNKRCIKIIPISKFNDNEWEASQILKNKDCSNIIICSEKIIKNNLVLLEMEFMTGGDLKNYVDNQKNKFSTEELYNIIFQICFFFFFFFFFFFHIQK
jgi:serine/threonine protein kinase